MRRQGLALGIVVLWLAGCIPYWTELYYEPSAPGGTLHTIPRCPGPSNALQFAIGDVTVGVGAHYRGGRLSASMWFGVPQDHIVRLLGSQMLLRLGDGHDAITGQFEKVLVTARRSPLPTIAADARMVGASTPVIEGSSRLASQGFVTNTSFDVPEPETFTLITPRLSVDGTATALPEVRFTRKRHRYVMAPINC